MACCSLLLCASLLVGAVEQSREVSRLHGCQMNLKRIGLAFHNYHDVFQGFAPGWVQPFEQADGTPGYGWSASLLPYLEQVNLYNSLNFNRMPDEAIPALQTAIRIYRCPSDPTELTNSLRGRFGTSNYSGNCGSDSLPSWGPSPTATFWPGSLAGPEFTIGVLWRNSFIRLQHISDGSSNTFLAGERCLTSAAGIWPGVRSNKNFSDLLTDCSAGNEPNSSLTSFSSMHAGGANFLMCDGAVRFIKNSIDSRAGEKEAMGTYQRLAHRADGQVIDGF